MKTTNQSRKCLSINALVGAGFLALLISFSSIQAGTSLTAKVPCRKILDNGLDKDRIVLLVTGEGYSKQQSQMFKSDVDRLIMNGLLGHDFFLDNRKAFNVYVAENWSNSPGTTAGSGPKKDTAFDISFNDNQWGNYFGEWYKNKKTIRQLSISEASTPSQPDHIILLVNTDHQGHGGETLGSYITLISNADPWWVLQHEMGHAIGKLLDEYSADNNLVYKGPAYELGNSSTKGERYSVPWSAFVDPSTPVPTPFWYTPKNGIGVFVGGATYAKGTYRPSMRCRMNNSQDPFCKVCKDYMTLVLNQKNPDPNTPLAILKRGWNVGLELEDVFTMHKDIEKTFGFSMKKSTLLMPMEPKPLPFLTPPSLSLPDFLVVQTYDKNGPKQTKQIPNPFLLRSFPAKGKKVEFTKILDQVSLGLRLPVSYDPVKEGFGVRLYKLNQTEGSETTIADLKGLKGRAVERVSAKGENRKGAAVPAVAPHVALPPYVDQSMLEQLKNESKVTLIKQFPAK